MEFKPTYYKVVTPAPSAQT